MPGFRVRRTTLRDIPLLVEHRNSMFDEYDLMTPEERRTAGEAYPAWAREMLRRKLFHGYVVETSGGKVAASGCVWLRQVQPSRGQSASLVPYLMSIYTDPAFRRKGLASMVVKEAMSWAKKSGYRKMTLHASMIGRKVYSQLGWKRTWEMEVRLDRPPSSTRTSTRPSRRGPRPSRARARARTTPMLRPRRG